MDDTLAQLEAEYCPPLEGALLAAIVLDYDLTNPTGVAEARKTLDALRESALIEEQTGFDPSGTGAPNHADRAVGKRPESCPETSESLSPDTDITSLSNDLSAADLNSADVSDADGETTVVEAENLEGLDEETKVQLLQDLFGSQVSKYSIEHTLKKCNGRWNAAMEELLNHVYFSENDGAHEDGIRAKGIDGFSQEAMLAHARKSKRGKKRTKSGTSSKTASLPGSGTVSPERQVNRWQSSSEDIEFISVRTGISKSTVSSTYYNKGASIPRTIGSLLKASMEESKLIVTDDAIVASHARELGHEFPNIAPDYLSTIIRLTYPSTASAHELATALTSKPKTEGGIQIVPRLAPLDGVHSAADWQPVARKAKGSARPRSPSTADDAPSAALRRDAYSVAQATAFAQARAAHRKAKSNPLMGGAAAHYGQVGRDYAALSAGASASAADELAASQSTSTQLDLHGVDVANAVRIAQERVEEWWYGLGEGRVNGRAGAGDRQAGYRIVVGKGTHSEGGKGKLGPAVTKMLKAEGWRVQGEGAVLVVKGPVVRR